MEKVEFDLNQFLVAISFALDFVEIDLLGATQNHSRRVAYTAVRLAEELGLSNEEKSDIISCAILHDNGLCEEALTTKIEFQKFNQRQRIEGFSEHCEIGERNIKHYPFKTNPRKIILYHHEFYNGKGFHKLKGDQIPLMAQIIGIADFTDNIHHMESGNKDRVEKFFIDSRNNYFSESLVSTILKLTSKPKFWLDLKNEFISIALKEHYISNTLELTWPEIFKITKVLTSIIDSKSRFTGRHSTGLMEKAAMAADYYNFNQDLKYKLLVAASLHDLGKLAIPASILEKRAKLSVDEIKIIQSHTYYTKIALSRIDNFQDIKEWAGNHHEKLNGNGYPEGIGADRLDFNSRLMAVLDIYQALYEDRPYRESLDYPKIRNIMDKMVNENAIDGDIVGELIPWLDQRLRG